MPCWEYIYTRKTDRNGVKTARMRGYHWTTLSENDEKTVRKLIEKLDNTLIIESLKQIRARGAAEDTDDETRAMGSLL